MGNIHIIFDLIQAGNFELALRESKNLLQADPNNFRAHAACALSLIYLDRAKEASPHVKSVLDGRPEDPYSYFVASQHAWKLSRWRVMERHAQAGCELDPLYSHFHYHLSVATGSRLKFKQAIKHIEKARELDPDDPEILRYQLSLASLKDDSAADAWERVEALEDSLQRDPLNAGTHHKLGDVFLTELHDAEKAEFHFREAVRLDPNDRDYQKDLFDAIGSRSSWFKTLRLASNGWDKVKWSLVALRYKPWHLIWYIVAIKFVLIYAAWLLTATFIFWPCCKFYEWMMISELRQGAATSVKNIRAWSSFHQLPKGVRILSFLAVTLGFYALILSFLPSSFTSEAIVMVSFFLFHYVLVLMWMGYKKIQRKRGKKVLAKRKRKQELTEPTS